MAQVDVAKSACDHPGDALSACAQSLSTCDPFTDRPKPAKNTSQSVKLVDAKDLANEMGICLRTLRRLWKQFHVPPTIPANADHKWSREDANKLIRRRQRYWQKKLKLTYAGQNRR